MERNEEGKEDEDYEKEGEGRQRNRSVGHRVGSKVNVSKIEVILSSILQTILKTSTKRMLDGKRHITWKFGETIKSFMMKKVSNQILALD